MVDKAKGDFITRKLNQNSRNPKRFWQSLNDIIKDKVEVDINNIAFINPNSGQVVDRENTPAFLNEFFANIGEYTRGSDIDIDGDIQADVGMNGLPGFDFAPVTIECFYRFITEIDTDMASCIEGINMRICKLMLENFSEKWLKLFGNSLYTGTFPKEWTCSIVTLLPKTGDLSHPGNWRPISQTCIFAKILENIVKTRLQSYLIDHSLLSEYQFGFLPHRSTKEAVFELTKSMYSTINNRKLMAMVFLDVAKAFNCIHHGRLFKKLESIGCSNRCVSWFKSYLDRSQIISLKDRKSDSISVSSGIAQGTVLGPLIFIFYLNDIVRSLRRCHISMFADDCVLYLTGNNWLAVHDNLQAELDSFIEWCSLNGLKINCNKTKTMIVSTSTRLKRIGDIPHFKILGQNVQIVSQYNYLGVILDNEMSLSPLLKNIKKRISNRMFQLRKIRKYVNTHAATLIYKQTILPIFDYPGFLLISVNNGEKHDLQIMENDAIRFCKGLKLLDKVSIPVIHNSIHLLSLEQRRQKQILKIMYIQSQKGRSRAVTNVNTRSQTKYVFKTDTKIGKKYEKSPYYLGTRLWNGLDKVTQDSDSIYTFNKKICRLYNKYNPLL